jgi:hypothetical protein
VKKVIIRKSWGSGGGNGIVSDGMKIISILLFLAEKSSVIELGHSSGVPIKFHKMERILRIMIAAPPILMERAADNCFTMLL